MNVKDSIWSLKMRVTINGEKMNLFDARDRGLIELNRDPHWGYYSYRVLNTGQVVSFYRHFRPEDQSDWYKEAIKKGPETVTVEGT